MTWDPRGSNLAFIVGHYKSGSTWLANLLGLHPDVRSLRETHLFRYSKESESLSACTQGLFEEVAWSGGRSSWLRVRLASLARPFRKAGQATLSWKERPTTRLDLSLADQRRLHESLLAETDVDEYRRTFYRELFRSLKPRRFLLEKTSTNVFWVPEVQRVFPQARQIAIFRDGRDVVVSDKFHLRNYYQREQDFPQSVRDWRDAMKAQIQSARENNLYTLSYEALLSDTVGETQRLLAFLELPTPQKTLDDMVHRSSFRFVTGRKKGKEDAKSFYRKGVAGDWKNHLDDEQQRVFSEIAGDVLVELGYEEEQDWRSWS